MKRWLRLSSADLARRNTMVQEVGSVARGRRESFHACQPWVAETPGPVGKHILSFISSPDGFWRSKVRLSAAVMLLMSIGLCRREVGALLLITVGIKLESSRLKFLPLACTGSIDHSNLT